MIVKTFQFLLAVTLALTLTFGIGQKALAQPAETERVPVFIGLDQNLSTAKRNAIERDIEVRGGFVSHKYRIVNALAAQLPRRAISAIQSHPGVKYLEEDAVVQAVQQTLPWGVKRIGADLVHASGNKGSGVDVAVLDSGIDRSHPDLVANIAGGRNFTGWIFINPNNWDDDYGHGTHVAGIIAAVDNSQGVIGVAPESSLYIGKVLDRNGSGYWSWVVAGIEWAVVGPDGVLGTDDDAEVINMSLGGPYSSTVNTACQNAYEAGVVLVAAAGNDGGPVSYPAALPSVIGVSAIDNSDNIPSWSNYGTGIVLAAPGVQVYSTMPTYHVTMNNQGYMQDYAYMSGTSMASPHVAGTAALVIASGMVNDTDGRYGVANEVWYRMGTTAEDLGTPGWDFYYGHGVVNADEAALPAMPNTSPIADSGGPYSGTEDVTVTFDGSGSSDPDGDPLTYAWDFGDGSTGTGVTPTHVYAAGGTYTVTLIVNDGKVDSDPSTTTADITEINDPPVADAGPDQTALVEDVVNFDASGSHDIDGTIVTYNWDFGDGNTETGMTTAHAYATVGTYTVVLTVTDNGGLTDTDEAIVTITEVATNVMHVASIDISVTTKTAGRRNKFALASAEVIIVDANGTPVEGATVHGQWSGLTSDIDSGITDASGKVVLPSDSVKNRSGTFTFTVYDITKEGWTYDPNANLETSDSKEIP